MKTDIFRTLLLGTWLFLVRTSSEPAPPLICGREALLPAPFMALLPALLLLFFLIVGEDFFAEGKGVAMAEPSTFFLAGECVYRNPPPAMGTLVMVAAKAMFPEDAATFLGTTAAAESLSFFSRRSALLYLSESLKCFIRFLYSFSCKEWINFFKSRTCR